MKVFNFIDLFSGAGGFTEGLLLAEDKNSEFNLVCASDIHENAQITHDNRYKDLFGLNYDFIVGDIREKETQDDILKAAFSHDNGKGIDVIVGGPPCQGFSLFGARNEDDPRNDLFRHYLNMIKTINPKPKSNLILLKILPEIYLVL